MSRVLTSAMQAFAEDAALLIKVLQSVTEIPADDLVSDIKHSMSNVLRLLRRKDPQELTTAMSELDSGIHALSQAMVRIEQQQQVETIAVDAETASALHAMVWNLLSVVGNFTFPVERYKEYVHALVAVGQFDSAVRVVRAHRDRELLLWLRDYMVEELQLRKTGKPRSQGFSMSGIQSYIEVAERMLISWD